ncbi:minor tail protein [Brevundimonas phage vB_BsubS-Delta]|nr:minor tail protein [Brevundimonas phage vB_BsubS-Delta]
MALIPFAYTGAAVVYNVTATKQYAIELWGGGGGAGRYQNNYESGGGGYLLLRINLTAGDVLTIEVGQGGGPGIGTGTIQGGYGGWPDGGWGARGDTQGGGGGGSSRVWLNGTLLAVAGAGGGSGGYSVGGHAGAGGGDVGQSSSINNGGSGGSQTAGGVDQNQTANVPKRGDYLKGGFGAGNVADRFTNTSDDGGGGGGGYYGGGGGGGDGSSGGGGSSWADPSRVIAFLTLTGALRQPGGQTSFNYTPGVGLGALSVNALAGGVAGGNGQVLIDDNPGPESVVVSKSIAYAVVRLGPGVYASKASAYAVLKEAEPVPVDFEFIVSKSVAYGVVKPGSNGPLTTVTNTASEIVHGGRPSARIAHAALSVLQTRSGAARASNAKLEALFTKDGAARFTHAALEVLRSTAEVTVQGLVSHTALSVLYRPEVAQIRVSTLSVEVLRTAEAENERFAVISLMN